MEEKDIYTEVNGRKFYTHTIRQGKMIDEKTNEVFKLLKGLTVDEFERVLHSVKLIMKENTII